MLYFVIINIAYCVQFFIFIKNKVYAEPLFCRHPLNHVRYMAGTGQDLMSVSRLIICCLGA